MLLNHVLLLLVSLSATSAHSCGNNIHNNTTSLKAFNNNNDENDVSLLNINEFNVTLNKDWTESSQNKLRRNAAKKEFTPIRIYIDYTTIDKQTSVNETYRAQVKDILESSKQNFEVLLYVQRFKNKMKLLECANDKIFISDRVKKEGVDADWIIFPYIDDEPNHTFEAYASPCVWAGDTKRPVAGFIAFAKKWKFSSDNWLRYYTTLSMHELTHVLVFSPNLFPFYLKADGRNYNMDEITKVITTDNGLQKTLITTPKVVETARRHFNCDNIEGVELENQGGEGTSGSHWEARLMLTDYMIGESYDEMSMSEITLALFEDSGWYKVNYYTGGLFRFGKNQGCKFLNSTCLTNGTTNFKNEYCDTTYAPFCTNGRLSKGICYHSKSDKNIPSSFQYFNNDAQRGGLILADYCPVSQVPSDKRWWFNWSCAYGRSSYPIDLGEIISDSSSCFISSLREKSSWISQVFTRPRSICYKYECNYSEKQWYIYLNDKRIKCDSTEGNVTVEGYDGSVECPEYNNICTQTIPCNDMMDCIQKHSFPDYTTFDFVSRLTSNRTLL